MKLAKTLKQEYDQLEEEVKQKISYGDYVANPEQAKNLIETIKNVSIGKKERSIKNKKGIMFNYL